MNLKDYNAELYHWGIKGQKWGVRRYQNADGTLTPAGKKRYDDGSPEKSKHRQKLEAKYRAQGMSAKNAELAASRRIRTEKIIGATAGLTVAAVSAYAISKSVKARTDKIIKAGTSVQRITQNPDESLDRPFFAAYKDADKTKYKGLMGQNHFGRQNVHKVSLEAKQDIKVVSRKKAADTFAELYKQDDEFREAFEKSNSRFLRFDGPNAHKVAAGKMTDRQLKKAGYDAFNIGLVNHDENGSHIAKKFYSKLKEKGYDAVADINDQKYSGYKAKQPVIVFNKAGKLSVSDVRKLTDAEMASNAKKAYKSIYRTEATKLGAKFVSSVAAGSLWTSSVNTLQINNYRREHPNTSLSDNEILKAINGGG